MIAWAYVGIVVKEADPAFVPIAAGAGAIAVAIAALLSLAGRLPSTNRAVSAG